VIHANFVTMYLCHDLSGKEADGKVVISMSSTTQTMPCRLACEKQTQCCKQMAVCNLKLAVGRTAACQLPFMHEN